MSACAETLQRLHARNPTVSRRPTANSHSNSLWGQGRTPRRLGGPSLAPARGPSWGLLGCLGEKVRSVPSVPGLPWEAVYPNRV